MVLVEWGDFILSCRVDENLGLGDFYENKHLNSDLLAINFTDMTDDEFHEALYDANEKLLKKYFRNRLDSNLNEAKRLYYEGDVTFRGFRQL